MPLDLDFGSYPSLRDKVVLVTGGGSGIGACMVESLARIGARVAFVDIEETASQALAARLDDADHRPLFLPCDLRDIAALRAAVGTIRQEIGPVGVLVNNAARDDRHAFEEVGPDYWDDCVATNLRHQYFAAQAVCSHMRERGGGSIINLSSVAWMFGTKDLSVYATAKAAIIGLTRSLARELGPDNIRVNAIAPGPVMTERQRRLWFDEAAIAAMVARQCLHTVLEPIDIARAALFLAADDSRLITRQCLTVDAGIR